jgi:hypothetical protein
LRQLDRIGRLAHIAFDLAPEDATADLQLGLGE